MTHDSLAPPTQQEILPNNIGFMTVIMKQDFCDLINPLSLLQSDGIGSFY